MHSSRSLLTVFTPTYNRREKLGRLYASLCAQTDMRFEWLVVDDGSDDGTESLVSEWAGGAPFSIRCIHQKNSGKHVAHNLGAREAYGALFMCVDSDDWLEPDAVETVLCDAAALDTEEGLLYPKLFAGQTALDTWFPEDVEMVELADMRIRFGLAVETAIIFKTNTLRRHPFPIVQGELYMPEESAYFDFRDPELFHVRSACFYRSEYQEDGLTMNIWGNWYRNPKGTVIALRKRYEAACRYIGWCPLRSRISAIAGIESLNIARRNSPLDYLGGTGFLKFALLPLSVILSRLRFAELKHE